MRRLQVSESQPLLWLFLLLLLLLAVAEVSPREEGMIILKKNPGIFLKNRNMFAGACWFFLLCVFSK